VFACTRICLEFGRAIFDGLRLGTGVGIRYGQEYGVLEMFCFNNEIHIGQPDEHPEWILCFQQVMIQTGFLRHIAHRTLEN
jgi:hypothetical protein